MLDTCISEMTSFLRCGSSTLFALSPRTSFLSRSDCISTFCNWNQELFIKLQIILMLFLKYKLKCKVGKMSLLYLRLKSQTIPYNTAKAVLLSRDHDVIVKLRSRQILTSTSSPPTIPSQCQKANRLLNVSLLFILYSTVAETNCAVPSFAINFLLLSSARK